MLFRGRSEGDQLFAIFRLIGSPTQEEYDELTKLIPFDPKIIKEFGFHKKQSLRDNFKNIQDIDNLIDLLARMFAFVPENRLTAVQALEHPFFDEVRN